MESVSREFTFDQKKVLTPQDQSACIRSFAAYDKNSDNTMDEAEFKNIMVDLGYRKITDEKVAEMLAAQDKNKDGVISWEEFVNMMVAMKGSDDGKFGTIVDGKAQITGEHGGTHTYSIEERTTFAKMINLILKDDADCKDRLPMNVNDESLFHVFDNGILLCKLLLTIDSGCLDERALNRQNNANIYQVKENLNMGIASCKGLGVKMIGTDSNSFINKVPHMILGCLWQTIRMWVTKNISLKDTPEIMKLGQDGEELKDILKLSPETVLIRWINYHLAKAGQDRKVTNLGKDLSDSFALYHVLNQLDGDKCPLDGIDEEDLEKRAEKMISNSLALGVPDLVCGKDITTSNTKINTVFVASIFNTKHGLEELTKEEYEAAGMVDDDVEGSREERTFRFFINSLGIEDVYINDFCEDLRDGVYLAKVCHRIDDKSVDWKKIDMVPNNDFKKNINNNTVVEAGKNMKLKLIGIGGVDLTKGEKKSLLALVWQLVRLYYLKLIGDKKEDELVQWVNDTVGDKLPQIKDFKDKSLSDGRHMIQVCSAIESRAVNWDLVTEGATDDDKKNNAKYAISVARKLGAVIFCVWEDINTVNPK
jgi:plastin-1